MFNLMQGDCLELMKNIPDGSIDMVLTDPPYQKTKLSWDNVIPFEPMWEQLKRIIKPNGAICLFGVEPFSSKLRLSNEKMFKYDWVWQKNRHSNFMNAKNEPKRIYEIISVFYKKRPTYNAQLLPVSEETMKRNNRNSFSKKRQEGGQYEEIDLIDRKDKKKGQPINIIKYNLEQNNQYKKAVFHPTQKPVALLEYLIKTYTLENETVLDFTMGSGSTGVAAKNLNRSFIGIELDENYYQIAKERIENA